MTKPETAQATCSKPQGLALLREPFPERHISKLPKPTKKQTEDVRDDFKKGVRCGICGAWHHPDVVHLDYVGHAALTDRLLDADPAWNWEPLGVDALGLPALDQRGGLWIKLTVCGQTRLGYGGADGKSGTDAIKELIGDALRNAAMRFGAALDLWHKGDLHGVEDDEEDKGAPMPKPETKKVADKDTPKAVDPLAKFFARESYDFGEMSDADFAKKVTNAINAAPTVEAITKLQNDNMDHINAVSANNKGLYDMIQLAVKSRQSILIQAPHEERAA